ncbi:60S ribosomal protein L28 [Trichuris trichiura]|uniref:Large ribosomal subunit protein eL28 n=1 Tax=Trichuris trichiura TaxID=36087 RepID=A0A077Z252_TRITR|nr:60S ribosomal protein L28 [Trichuris trichiura]
MIFSTDSTLCLPFFKASMNSSQILWSCVKDSSCFIRKQRGVNKAFTREPFNLWGTHNYFNCGFIRKQALDIRAAPAGKGILMTLRKKSSKTMKAIASVLKNNHYPRRMKRVNEQLKYAVVQRSAQKRASQILRSQMVKVSTKRRRQRREKQKK